MPYPTKHTDADFQPFVLDDGTGTVYVDPSDGDLLVSEDEEIVVDPGDDPPEFVREYLIRETDVDPVGQTERKYREARLEIDDQVRVSGHADPDAAPALDEPVTTAVVTAGEAPKFLISDDVDLGLRRRLLREATVYFLLAICFAVTYVVLR
ncbi:MAG: hypothetical protein ABEI96_09965 [Haloarculaceae archaeon]